MKEKKGSSLLETKRRNRVWIKDTIFRKEPVTRTDIAQELELTLPTITTSVNEMIKQGILEEVPMPEEKLVNAVGRRPGAIRFVSDIAWAVGVELDPYATRAVLMNIKGEVLGCSEKGPAAGNYETMVRDVSVQILELLNGADRGNVLGAGIGLPGLIECENGVIQSSYHKDWCGRKLAGDMERLLGLPVMINNNSRMRAFGYGMNLRGNGPDSFAYYYISGNISCPLMVKSGILSGYTAIAGDAGHMILWTERNRQRCLDELAGEKAILDKCRKRKKAGALKPMEEGNGLTLKEVLKAQREKDEDVCRILEESIKYLAAGLSNVVNLVNTGFVAVEGCLMEAGPNRTMLEQQARNGFCGLNEEVKIEFVPYDSLNGAKGAAYFIMRRLFLEK